MRLAAKLALAFTLILAGGLAVQATLDVRRVRELHREELRQDLHLVGHAVGRATSELWARSGAEAAHAYVQSANADHSRIRIHLTSEGGEPASAGPAGGLRLEVPLTVRGDEVARLALTRSLAAERAFLDQLLADKALVAAALLLGCGLLVGVTGARLLGRPLRRLTDQVERIGAGQYTSSPEPRARDEIGILARSMNEMTERLAAAQERIRDERSARTHALEQLRHADRLATVGKLASGIAHQLGTPLNVVTGRATMIASSEAAEEIRQDARKIDDAAQGMARIIHQLLQFSRSRGLRTERTQLRDVLERAESLVEPLAEREGVHIIIAEHEPVEAEIDTGKLLQVLTNLMTNAVQAMPEGGTLTLGAHHEHVAEPPEKRARPGDYVCVHVEDEGVGMSTDQLEHIFEPFFTTKSAGEGTGLGLSVSHGIVRQHGGWINVDSVPGEGSRFAVYLPEEYEG